MSSEEREPTGPDSSVLQQQSLRSGTTFKATLGENRSDILSCSVDCDGLSGIAENDIFKVRPVRAYLGVVQGEQKRRKGRLCFHNGMGARWFSTLETLLAMLL